MLFTSYTNSLIIQANFAFSKGDQTSQMGQMGPKAKRACHLSLNPSPLLYFHYSFPCIPYPLPLTPYPLPPWKSLSQFLYTEVKICYWFPQNRTPMTFLFLCPSERILKSSMSLDSKAAPLFLPTKVRDDKITISRIIHV